MPISLYEDGGKTVLATLKPTKLLAMFNVPELEQVAGEKLRCAFGWFVLAVAAFVLARNRPAFASIFSSEAP